MTLVNPLGPLNLEATQLLLLAELQQKLEPGQSVVVSSVGGTVTVTGTVALDAGTLAALETINAVQSGAWSVTIDNASIAVTGPLTDAQLRATPVPVDSGGLTDTELRATPVPVSGTVSVNEPVTVDGTVAVSNFPAPTGLTDTQLRATPVPVSGTVSVSEPVSVDDNGASLTTDGTFDERYSGGKSAYGVTVAASGDTTLLTPPSGQALRVVWVAAIPNSDNSNANLVKFKFGAGGSPFYQAYGLAHWEVFDGADDEPLMINCATAEPVAVTVHYRILP